MELQKNISKQLDSLINRTWMYEEKTFTVLSWEFVHEKLHIETDAGVITIPFGEIKEIISRFLPVGTKNVPATLPQKVIMQSQVINGNTFTELKGILMDNIKKVNENKEFIPQAVQVNESVKSVIELAKTELAMLKTIQDFQKA